MYLFVTSFNSKLNTFQKTSQIFRFIIISNVEVWKRTQYIYDHMNTHFAFFLSKTWIMIEYCTRVNDHISKD